jgi:hypothetical protein
MSPPEQYLEINLQIQLIPQLRDFLWGREGLLSGFRHIKIRLMHERNIITGTIEAAQTAVNFRLDFAKHALRDGPVPSDLYLILDTLKPWKLKYWIKYASSVNFGKSLLDEVFPKYDNPEEYHSRGDIVCLDEHPVQVMGWKECDAKKKEAIVKYHLDRNAVEHGFWTRAEERGIDLEWSFFEKVPQKKDPVSSFKPIESGLSKE